MYKKLALLLIFPLVFALSGCEDRYRYPCQDPDNWDKQECKKPWCSADGTCPEDLAHYEKKKSESTPTPEQTPAKKGVCK